MQQGSTNPAAIETALEKLATDLGDAGRDNVPGIGLVEARTTLRGLGLVKWNRTAWSSWAARRPEL